MAFHRPFAFCIVLSVIGCGSGSVKTDPDAGPTADDTGLVEDDPAPICPETAPLGIETSTGCILGENVGSLEQWLGIPYAEPPTGALRFARTVPVAPWSEALEADSFGNVCLQWDTSGLLPARIGDEDCLTLNIFRPEGTTPDSGLPVLFFTHGGAYVFGSGSEDLYALEPELAEGAIVVTHNYRLGPFGFLAHEDLSAEDDATHGDGGSSGNQGMFDTLAALEWVAANAAAMGGDPDNVMVFGESAGGSTTCALLASPLAEGLFQTALIQSSGCGFLEWPIRDPAGTGYAFSAEDVGDYIGSELGCTGSDAVGCMRDLDVDTIMDTLYGFEFYGNVDGVFLTGPARETFASGDFNPARIIAGFNENEGVYFTSALGIETDEELTELLGSMVQTYGLGDGSAVEAMYTSDAFGSPQRAYDAFYGDLFFACPTRAFLDAVSPHTETHGYFFTEAPDWLAAYPSIADWGAFHGAELALVFGTTPEFFSAAEWQLASTMQAAWIGALGEDPSVEGVGAWPRFDQNGGIDGDGGSLVEFNAAGNSTVASVFADRCDLLAELGWQTY